MRTIWHSLLWKEWHEHKWKLAALVAILLAVPLAFLFGEPNTIHSSMNAILFPYAILAGIFIAMSLAAGENAHRTMPFLQSLPVPLWRVALAKLCFASLTVVVPLLLLAGMLYAFDLVWSSYWVNYQPANARGNFIESWLANCVIGGSLGTLSLLLWVAAAGVNRQDEIRAGAIGLLVVAGLFTVNVLLEEYSSLEEPMKQTLLAAGPGGPTIIFHKNFVEYGGRPLSYALRDKQFWFAVVPALLSHGCLVGWYLWRFGRPSGFSIRSLKPVSAREKKATWLAPPRRSQFTAILWKQMRETAPLVVTALAGVLFFAVLVSRKDIEPYRSTSFKEALVGISTAVGFFVTIVAGIGIFHEDLKPGIHTFWRSRPVNVHLWFWIKFLTGLAILAIVFFGGIFLVVIMNEPVDDWSKAWTMIRIGVIAFVALYCWAVAATCVVRQPVYSAILTIGAIMFFTFGPIMFMSWMEWNGNNLHVLLGWIHAVLIGVGTLSAWIAGRYNLGYKG